MGDQPTEETQFVVDEVSNVIKEAIETTIGGNSYMVWSKYLNTIIRILLFSMLRSTSGLMELWNRAWPV